MVAGRFPVPPQRPRRSTNSSVKTKRPTVQNVDTAACVPLPFGLQLVKPGSASREWARRLLAFEAASELASADHKHEALRVCEKLRVCLTRFAGGDGFAALLRRALALAQADVPALQAVNFTADGHLEGFEDFVANSGDLGAEGAIAVTAHLLGLLVSFVGESITLRLVRNAWPDARLADEMSSNEDGA